MTPQIIRTVQELEALDPDTTCIPRGLDAAISANTMKKHFQILPAVVIATGDQVRQARKALEES